MQATPAVSVVIPLYNKGPYIARALNSVLAQTSQDYEVIVVDDGSTDDGADVVKEFKDHRIRLIQQDNQGVSAARNRGIEAANADLIAFLDADDEWLPGFLGKIIDLRIKFPLAGIYATAFMKKSFNGIYRKQKFFNIPSGKWEGLIPSYFRSCAYGRSPIRSSNVAIPKIVFSDVGMFPVGKWWGEDSDMWGRIALKYPVAFCSVEYAIYHFDDRNQATNLAKKTDMHPFVMNAQHALGNMPRGSQVYKDLEMYMAKQILATAKRNLKAGMCDFARENISRCPPNVLILRRVYLRSWSYLPTFLFNVYQDLLLKGWYYSLEFRNWVFSVILKNKLLRITKPK